ncbi:hypothetical protein Q7C36_003815 [Tachysurus vachellii]|uniref:Uncharacterized protein n=1 Tax=Tachysurus vachellii TaxID=175792 RepID=A0AA88TFF8_TACVA|nr:hypothetical protein Q7C36_003815 [Tachysurus vachellii]
MHSAQTFNLRASQSALPVEHSVTPFQRSDHTASSCSLLRLSKPAQIKRQWKSTTTKTLGETCFNETSVSSECEKLCRAFYFQPRVIQISEKEWEHSCRELNLKLKLHSKEKKKKN